MLCEYIGVMVLQGEGFSMLDSVIQWWSKEDLSFRAAIPPTTSQISLREGSAVAFRYAKESRAKRHGYVGPAKPGQRAGLRQKEKQKLSTGRPVG